MKKVFILAVVVLLWSCGSAPQEKPPEDKKNEAAVTGQATSADTSSEEKTVTETAAQDEDFEAVQEVQTDIAGDVKTASGTETGQQNLPTIDELFDINVELSSAPGSLADAIDTGFRIPDDAAKVQWIEYISPYNNLVFFRMGIYSGNVDDPLLKAEPKNPEPVQFADFSGPVTTGNPDSFLYYKEYLLYPKDQIDKNSKQLSLYYMPMLGNVDNLNQKVFDINLPDSLVKYSRNDIKMFQKMPKSLLFSFGNGKKRIICRINTLGEITKVFPESEYQFPVFNPFVNSLIYIKNGNESDIILPPDMKESGRLMISNGVTPEEELLSGALSFQTSVDYRYMLVWEKKDNKEAALIFADVDNERWIEIVSGPADKFEFKHSWGFIGDSGNFYYRKDGKLFINNIDTGSSYRSEFINNDYVYSLDDKNTFYYDLLDKVVAENKIPLLSGPEEVEKMFVDFHRIQSLKKMTELVPDKVLEKYSRGIPFNYADNEVRALKLIASIAKKYYSASQWKSFMDNYVISSMNNKALVESQLKKMKNIF